MRIRRKLIKLYNILTISTIFFILTIKRELFIELYSVYLIDYDEEPYVNLTYPPINSFKSTCSPYNTHHSSSQLFSVSIDNEKYPKYLPLYQNSTLNFACLNQNTNKKLILFWNKWFNDPVYEYGVGESTPFSQNRCPVTNCEITTDKKRLRESSIVVVHMRDYLFRLPKYRRPDQRWVFLLYESPLHSDNFKQYNGVFNLTATYQASSNFVSYYYTNALLEWTADNKDYDVNTDFHETKSLFAAVIISNCNDKSRRLEFIRELQQYVPVHVYGKCGRPCPEHVGDCKAYISSTYKFYLSFENSICKDYITEKLFDVLTYDVVPVVYGGGPYERHIPRSGYIDVFNYSTVKDLAEYLLHLNTNKTAYNSFFKWKKYLRYNEKTAKNGHICEMCIRLNLDYYTGIEKSVISDMESLWSDTKNCYTV